MKPNQLSTSIPLHRGISHLAGRAALALLAAAVTALPLRAAEPSEATAPAVHPTQYKTAKVEGLSIFYREAGPANAPTLVLLHGFPTSSNMFRNLIPALSDRYHVIAPDYPGYGQSSAPNVATFQYTFDHLASVVDALIQQLGVEKYSLYVMDYGAPVGFRIAGATPRARAVGIDHPERQRLRGRVDAISGSRSGRTGSDRSETNAEALRKLLVTDATRWQYTNGVRQVETIDPTNWLVDQTLMDRPGNKDIQLALFYSYGSNPPLYPAVAGVFPQAPAAHADRVGQERFHLPRRRRLPLPSRPQKRRVPSARYRALRPGRRRRNHRGVDSRLPGKTKPVTGRFYLALTIDQTTSYMKAIFRVIPAALVLATCVASAQDNMSGMPMHGPATMSMADMTKSLEPLKGKEFEIAFLTEMISHHASALEMAKWCLRTPHARS